MFNRVAKSIRNNILVGLVLVTPIVITGFIINGIFTFTTNRLVPETLQKSEYALFFRAGALLAVLVILFFIGLLVRNIIGRKLYSFGDKVLTRIPVINKVYLSVRQISEALVTQQQTMFKKVVFVEYPRKGLYSIAFVTANVPEQFTTLIDRESSDKWLSLFIPTTPNPTSGVLIFVPRTDVTDLPIRVTDAMKLIVSGGVAYPGTEPTDQRPTLLDKMQAWMKHESSEDDQRTSTENRNGTS